MGALLGSLQFLGMENVGDDSQRGGLG